MFASESRRPDPRSPLSSALLHLGLSLALAAAAPSQQTADAAEATRLRDDAAARWNQQDYRGASDLLQQAAAVYRRIGGDHRSDLAIVCRAIVWNEAMAGSGDSAMAWFGQLADAVAGDAALGAELDNAYGAIYRVAVAGDDDAAKVHLLESARSLLQQKSQPRLAAQCLHDIGSVRGDAGDLRAMRTALTQATDERRALGDTQGLGWSLCNRAHYELRAGLVEEAATPLQQAFELCLAGSAIDCQQALALNFADLIDTAREAGPSPSAVAAVWQIATAAAQSRRPFVLPPDRALRSALALDVRLRQTPKQAAAAVEQAKKLLARLEAPAVVPVEVRADLQVRLGLIAADGGSAGLAAAGRLLDGLDVGRGPCAQHLRARADAALAVLAARRGAVPDYDRLAPRAAAAMRALGDRGGLLELLQQLAEVEFKKGRSAVQIDLQGQLAALRREGGPGGDGASSASMQVGQLPANAGPDTVVFDLRWEPADDGLGCAVLTDRIGGRAQRYQLRWKPHHQSFNGCGIGLHGGYFVVRSMQYGGSSPAGGAAGQTTLDQLGSYLPLSADGIWEITRSGAVRFAAGR